MKPPTYPHTAGKSIRNLNDQEKDDPGEVDGVLTAELMKLSFQDRNEFQEEIHGVRCLAPEETPELLSQSLEKLQHVLDHEIPSHEKQAYLRSQHPQLGSQNGRGNPIKTYVNTTDFRLRFLRAELFDAEKAALRMVLFLDKVLELFGDYALQRPIRLSDFSKHEMKHVRKGRYQFLPYRDPGGMAGRKIYIVLPDEEWEAIPAYLRSKIMLYMVWRAGDDVDVQREGIVAIVWFDSSFKISAKPAISVKDHELTTTRVVAVHSCAPDTPLFRLRRSIMTMRIGSHLRTRLKIHIGENVELRYQLRAFGVPSDHLPITYTGKIKNVYFKQWMNVRQLIEESEAKNPVSPMLIYNGGAEASDSDSIHSNGVIRRSLADSMIESPYSSDIIFRKGASLVSHPGNAALQSLIVTKARMEVMDSGCSTTKTGQFVEEIIAQVRQIGRERVGKGTGKPCRFLVWNEKGWWTELHQENEIHTRIEYIARGIRNTVVKNHKKFAPTNTKTNDKPQTTTKSCKSKFVSSDSSACSSRSTTPDSQSKRIAIETSISPLTLPSTRKSKVAKTDNTMMAPKHTTTTNNTTSFGGLMQHQNGGTSIFRSLDYSYATPGQKRPLVMTGEQEQNSSSEPMCEAVCFGMKFNSTLR